MPVYLVQCWRLGGHKTSKTAFEPQIPDHEPQYRMTWTMACYHKDRKRGTVATKVTKLRKLQCWARPSCWEELVIETGVNLSLTLSSDKINHLLAHSRIDYPIRKQDRKQTVEMMVALADIRIVVFDAVNLYLDRRACRCASQVSGRSRRV